jgi:hypothetical protein
MEKLLTDLEGMGEAKMGVIRQALTQVNNQCASAEDISTVINAATAAGMDIPEDSVQGPGGKVYLSIGTTTGLIVSKAVDALAAAHSPPMSPPPRSSNENVYVRPPPQVIE